MWAVEVVVVGGVHEDGAKVVFVEDDHMIEALAPDGANQPLSNAIRPRRPKGSPDADDAQPRQPGREVSALDRVTVMDEGVGAASPGVASRSCCQIQAAVG